MISFPYPPEGSVRETFAQVRDTTFQLPLLFYRLLWFELVFSQPVWAYDKNGFYSLTL